MEKVYRISAEKNAGGFEWVIDCPNEHIAPMVLCLAVAGAREIADEMGAPVTAILKKFGGMLTNNADKIAEMIE